MQQGNDYTSQYYYPHHHPSPPPPPNPNPNTAEFSLPSSPFASAPPYYRPSELPNYPLYYQNTDPTPNPSEFPHLHQPYYSPYESPASFGQADARFNCNSEESCDLGLGEVVYAYDGGKAEPYGARGTNEFGSNTGAGLKFDDYGRPLGFEPAESRPPKIVRAAPKMEDQEDMRNGAQKFRVRLMSEGASVDTTDVLCQV